MTMMTSGRPEAYAKAGDEVTRLRAQGHKVGLLRLRLIVGFEHGAAPVRQLRGVLP